MDNAHERKLNLLSFITLIRAKVIAFTSHKCDFLVQDEYSKNHFKVDLKSVLLQNI